MVAAECRDAVHPLHRELRVGSGRDGANAALGLEQTLYRAEARSSSRHHLWGKRHTRHTHIDKEEQKKRRVREDTRDDVIYREIVRKTRERKENEKIGNERKLQRRRKRKSQNEDEKKEEKEEEEKRKTQEEEEGSEGDKIRKRKRSYESVLLPWALARCRRDRVVALPVQGRGTKRQAP